MIKYAWQAVKLHTKLYSENLKESNHLGDIRIDARVILKYILTDVTIKGTSYTIMLFDIN
jgi:hypothetical protein